MQCNTQRVGILDWRTLSLRIDAAAAAAAAEEGEWQTSCERGSSGDTMRSMGLTITHDSG